MEPESQQPFIDLIGLSIDKIAAQRDEFKAENKRLREAIKRLRDENPSTDDLCVLTFSLPALQALWAMIEDVKEEK